MDLFVENVKNIPWEAVGAGHPEKRIKTVNDVLTWQNSEAYYSLLGFINGVSVAVQGIRLTDKFYVSPAVEKLLSIFEKLNAFIDEAPPAEEPQRFGNSAFRTWSHKMNHDIFYLLQRSIPEEKCHLVTELGCYLSASFGNDVRIDYGTGHELAFMFFLCALFKANILHEEDNVACALLLFNTYLTFVRRLQKTYRMEPAGSQGVWSLDDYQFIPFVWGSAQLCHNTPFPPIKFLDEDIINQYKDNYMFIGCIDFIHHVKTGHFAEHSYQLWCISAVPEWPKIHCGLIKMYLNEILSKYPVMQHVYFGKLMSFDAVPLNTPFPTVRLGVVLPTQRSPKIRSVDDNKQSTDEPSKQPPFSHVKLDTQSTNSSSGSAH